MRIRRRAVAFAAASLFSLPVSAQTAPSFNLRDLLTDLLRNGITLAPPLTGISHEAHFSAGDSPQFAALMHMGDEFSNQLSNFPLASSAGGFTYRFDPSAGVFVRSSESFGPIYAERAESIGTGKFNLGLSYSHFTFDRLHGLKLRQGDIKLVFTHADVNGDNSNLQPFVEGDVITGTLFTKVDTDITAFVMTYGVTDRLDVGVALPIVRVDLKIRTDLQIQRLATKAFPDIHRFIGGGSAQTVSQSGSASGIGDVVLRGKYEFLRTEKAGVAFATDLRLPTGDENELLGAGATRVKAFGIGSIHLGKLSPHVNLGYTWNTKARDGHRFADSFNYSAGLDWAVHPRLTFAADAIGNSFRNATILRVENQTYQANTNPDPTQPPKIVTATFPQLNMVDGQNYWAALGAVGLKINPFGNFLITVNALFPIKKESLQDNLTGLVAIDYSF